jgi:MMP 1-O-methyltransferase
MDSQTYQIVKDIPGWLTKHEGMFLEQAAKSVKGTDGAIVEIGSYCGKSTIWLAQAGELVFAIDPHKGEVSGGNTKPTLSQFRAFIKHAGVEKIVKPLVKTSHQAHMGWKNPIKMLFIDGLHDEHHAQEDFSLWAPEVIPGGIVAMHDAFCGWAGAGDVAMREIVTSDRFGEIGVVGSIIYGVKGQARGFFRVTKVCNSAIIALCNYIYRSSVVPKRVQFILVHGFLRLFLINRFTRLD